MSLTKHPSPATFALIASAVLLLAVLPLLVPGQAMAARTTVFPLIIDFEGGLPSN